VGGSPITYKAGISDAQPVGQDGDASLGDLMAAGAGEGPEDLLALPGLMAALPELEREVIMLRFFQDLDQYEIAARVGFSQLHVSRLQRRALARMRAPAGRALTGEGGEMQVMWMVIITLVLVLSGILGLALVAHAGAGTRRR
jgi:hypothetical protein